MKVCLTRIYLDDTLAKTSVFLGISNLNEVQVACIKNSDEKLIENADLREDLFKGFIFCNSATLALLKSLRNLESTDSSVEFKLKADSIMVGYPSRNEEGSYTLSSNSLADLPNGSGYLPAIENCIKQLSNALGSKITV